MVGGAKSSWRITVRQLESMIRLSEAMARLHCSEEVLPKHVQESFRLLNKSIIRVETPEINFEEEPVTLPPNEEDMTNDTTNGDSSEHMDGDGSTDKPVKPVGRKIRVTYEQYRTIANLLVLHLRKVEEVAEDGKLWLSCCLHCV